MFGARDFSLTLKSAHGVVKQVLFPELNFPTEENIIYLETISLTEELWVVYK